MKKVFKTINKHFNSSVALLCLITMIVTMMSVSTISVFANEKLDTSDIDVNQAPMQTIYDEPATKWQSESLPLGNGFIGASVFGGVSSEEILINEHSIWSGGPGANADYDGGMAGSPEDNQAALKNAREQLQKVMDEFRASYTPGVGSTKNYPSSLSSVSSYILSNLLGEHENFGSYQELGRIRIDDLTKAIILTAYGENCINASYDAGNCCVSNLFDGDTSTKWLSSDGGTADDKVNKYDGNDALVLRYSSPLAVSNYRIQLGNDSVKWGRVPTSWKLYGSNDGERWTEVQHITNAGFSTASDTYEQKVYSLDATVEYSWYKFEFLTLSLNEDASTKRLFGVQLSELSFNVGSESESTAVQNYIRKLDLDNAVVTVNYSQGSVKYGREYFVSNPDNFMAGRLTAEGGTMDKLFRFTTPQTKAVVSAENGIITITGCPADQVEEEHLKFASQIRVKTDGNVTTVSDSVLVSNATWIEFYMTAGTNYQQCMDDTFDYFKDADPLDEVIARLDKVVDKGYQVLKQSHQNDYRNLFERVKINLGDCQQPEKMTNDLLIGYSNGNNTKEENRYLEALFYQFGRYLMISSSREGSLPANLQGIWGEGLDMKWKSDYHANINLQMNYWLAEQTNLSECHQPMIDYINSLVPRGEITANTYHYNVNDENAEVRGWTTYHENNIWGNTAPSNYYHGCSFFPTAGAWLAQHIWEQYAFTLDEEALEANWETLLGAALFWVDNLVEDSDGSLVSSPSFSPEHGPFSMGASADQVIIWEVFNNTLKAAEVLGINTSEIEEIRRAQSKLYLPKIGVNGQYMEWKEEITLDITGDNGHRHVNHLYAIHPGTLVVAGRSEEDDAYVKAMKQTLNTRGDGGTGWSMAWKLNFWARLRDGDHAFKLLQKQLIRTDKQTVDMSSGGTYDNLFDAHPPFQIDGNFGAVSGMTELFIQSQGDVIELLPALPTSWYGSSISGLRARGNVEIDIQTDSNGKLAKAVLKPESNHESLKVSAVGLSDYAVIDSKGNRIATDCVNKNTLAFAVEAGETYTLVEDKSAHVSNVILDKSVVVLTVGDTFTLNASVSPETASNKNVTWTSSNEDVAVVNNGIVTAIGNGNAVIRVTADDGGASATCNIIVGDVTIDKSEVVLDVGNVVTLKAIISAGTNFNNNFKWTSSNEKVAVVNNGTVTAVGRGTAIITVTADGSGISATCKITVTSCLKGHTEVVDAKVAPTCTESGLTEGKHCRVCGEIITEQVEIPAEGHKWSDSDGKCVVCDETNPDHKPPVIEPGNTDDQPKDHTECKSNWFAELWNSIVNFFRRLVGLPEKCVCGKNK